MVDGLEKERDFYFSKLRDIELICQEHESENSPVISGIIGILYATEVSPAGHLMGLPASYQTRDQKGPWGARASEGSWLKAPAQGPTEHVQWAGGWNPGRLRATCRSPQLRPACLAQHLAPFHPPGRICTP